MFEWPKTLLRGLADNNLTILFGAGIPHEFGFPLWNELVEKLEKGITKKLEMDEKNELTEFINSRDYLNAIELLMFKDRENVIDIIEESFNYDDFNKYDLKNSNENLLFALNANTYITTNIDNSLEEIKGLSGKKRANIYCYKNEQDIKDKLIFHNPENDPLILRIHGELKDHSSLIFSQSQYSNLNREYLFVFEQLLPSLFLTSIVLIVGYSINDPDIQLILEKSSKVKGNRNNIFFINADKNLTDYKKRMLLERYGIKVLDIHNEQTDITKILKVNLKELVSIKKKLLNCSFDEKRDFFQKGDLTDLFNKKI